jgi:acyl carrier protein
MDFFRENADREGVPLPGPAQDLFKAGALNSFGLVDLVTLLEQACGIKIPDSDVNPEKFRTLEIIDRYVREHRG